MFNTFSKELLQIGIIEAKGGNNATARHYLERAVAAATPVDHDLLAEIWYWLSQVTAEVSEKRKALENVLSYDLNHSRARRELALLDGKIRTDELVDPDRVPTPGESDQPVETQRFVCPNCGGRMVFSPDGSSLVCEHCAGVQKITSHPGPQEQDFIIAMATARAHNKPLKEQVFQCQGCSAQYILQGQQLSFNCVYCSSTHVVRLDASGDLIAADAMLPQAFSHQRAARLLVEWVQIKKIKPEKQVVWPRGLYLPVWIFNFGGYIDYTGELTEAEWSPDQGAVVQNRRIADRYPVMLDDLSIPANHKKTRQMLVKLIPSFDLKTMVPYDPRYLADWPAEVYDISLADASLDARDQAYIRLKADMQAALGQIRIQHSSSANLTIEAFKLALLPIWMTEVSFLGRPHLVMINGQNGVVQGEGA
jgi:predicted RNA-binding Zn-ribbon protein involved in translation (DUF1610 family)